MLHGEKVGTSLLLHTSVKKEHLVIMMQ